MGRQTRALLSQAKESFAERNTAAAHDLVRQDAEINRLNRSIFNRAVEIGDDLELREWAMFMILAARAIERIADNTVDIAEQTAFVVTGLFREFTDASQPALESRPPARRPTVTDQRSESKALGSATSRRTENHTRPIEPEQTRNPLLLHRADLKAARRGQGPRQPQRPRPASLAPRYCAVVAPDAPNARKEGVGAFPAWIGSGHAGPRLRMFRQVMFGFRHVWRDDQVSTKRPIAQPYPRCKANCCRAPAAFSTLRT